ncbi:hypothetical protein STCU_09414 [Strigomonas culicis]|uniref:Non-canonical E2 ubiquitin-conjugating enzyme C-terminal domain-containing protein n=1 Tax=Strigomonas culicis TaxID=28005 RepID=S9TML9_9TRYP|nr:hypothetical protein STCU_09414 [Strigomonas culicis]|eukprot:EPY19507.1 hypothetical protein STCU_09414 [Strigomonas culicis]
MRGIILASCYTDKVDTHNALKKNRDNMIVKEILNALTGLIIGLDIKMAETLLKTKDFTPYKDKICLAIETCRRYKIMNPDMLRTDYVKFLYMVQDAVQSEALNEILGFSVAAELLTVGRYARENGFEEMLRDPRLPLCITPVPLMKSRDVLNKCLRCKDQTVNELLRATGAKHRVDENTVEIAVRSLNDANCFSNDNVKTTEQLLELLKTYFKPGSSTQGTDLSITEGKDGSRLTHEHRRQYYYVLQSLTLWKNICRQMYSLWTIAEEDMLNPNEKYELRSTGQGLQRVQKAPTLYRAIQDVLAQTKQELGEWVGSERIHLGDDQVPNAFHFIDKYGQVSRILIPILRTLEHIDLLEKGDGSRLHSKGDGQHYRDYVAEVWGSGEKAKQAVLRVLFPVRIRWQRWRQHGRRRQLH